MNILVIGNGFDLAHGLPTKYTDFLKFIEIIKQILDAKNVKDLDSIKWEKITESMKMKIKSKIGNKKDISFSKKEEWKTLLDDNFWIEYFLQNPMYRQNWIDFESEICRVVKSIDEDMHYEEHKHYELEDHMVKVSHPFLKKYYKEHTMVSQSISVVTNGRSKSVTYREIRDRLLRDLNRLIRALEIYLCEYVDALECNTISPDIKGTHFDAVLSFNYTNTYRKLYDSEDEVDYDYIHGQADSTKSIDTNNMVLGIDEYLSNARKDEEVEFIAFKKFYQRIHKETGCKYMDWVDEIVEDKQTFLESMGRESDEPIPYGAFCDGIQHNLYIFGHSLDVTDKDVLRRLILNDNVFTTIYYVNKDVYGQQIANLVKVIGQDELIRRTGGSTKTIDFILQKDMVLDK